MAGLLTWHQAYEGGRIVASRGQIEVGAVFPDADGKARWSFWLGSRFSTPQKAKTVLAAKSEVIAAMMDFMRATNLTESRP